MQEIQFADAAIQSRRRVSTYSYQPTANQVCSSKFLFHLSLYSLSSLIILYLGELPILIPINLLTK